MFSIKTKYCQGGIISPLLANIFLTQLDNQFNLPRTTNRDIVTMIRYADDFIIISKYRHTLEIIFKILTECLKSNKLSLNNVKSTIVHKSEGFSFLGFRIIQYPRRTIWIQADKSRIKKYHKRIKEVIWNNKQVKTDELIMKLNPMILGWARYYQYSKIHSVFHKMDEFIFRRIWKWCCRRHPNKSKYWIKDKYFHRVGTRDWILHGELRNLSYVTDIKSKKYLWRVGYLSYFNPRDRRYWKYKTEQTNKMDEIIPFSCITRATNA